MFSCSVEVTFKTITMDRTWVLLYPYIFLMSCSIALIVHVTVYHLDVKPVCDFLELLLSAS